MNFNLGDEKNSTSDMDVTYENESMAISNPKEEEENIPEEEEIQMIEDKEEIENVSQNLEICQDEENKLDIPDKTHTYNLRPSRDPGYLYKYSFLSINAGLKKWGDKAKIP